MYPGVPIPGVSLTNHSTPPPVLLETTVPYCKSIAEKRDSSFL